MREEFNRGSQECCIGTLFLNNFSSAPHHYLAKLNTKQRDKCGCSSFTSTLVSYCDEAFACFTLLPNFKMRTRRSGSAVFPHVSGWTKGSFMQPETNRSLLEIEKHPTVSCTRCGQPLRAQHVQLTIMSRLGERQGFDISTILSWAKHVLKKHHCTYARDCSRIRQIKDTERAEFGLSVTIIVWIIFEKSLGPEGQDKLNLWASVKLIELSQ